MGLKAALTLCTAVVAALTAALQWRHRGGPTRVPLTLVMASAAVWAVAELLGDSPDPAVRSFANPILMPAGSVLATGSVWYALLLAGRTSVLTRRAAVIAFAEPVLITALCATNDLHQLVVVGPAAGPSTPAVLFWAHTVYAYGLIAAAVTLLLYAALRAVPGHRRVVLLVLASFVPPLVGNVVSVAFEQQDVDLTGALLLFTASGWLWIEQGRRPMQRVPIHTRQVLQALSDAILVIDEGGIVVELNEAGVELLGRPRSKVLGRPWTNLVDETLQTPLDEDGRAVVHLTDGRHLDVRVTPVEARGRQVGSGLVARDVTELERLRGELAEQALRDPLTGLHNRRRLSTVIDGLADRAPERLVAVMVDVDHFKQVNDTYGHAVGDKVLVAVAEELRRSVRSDDVVARVGGEEFALLLPGARVDDVVRRVDEVRRRCSAISVPEAPGLHLTISAGVAALDPDSPDVRGLLDVADRGVYQAKAQGRDRVVVTAA